jgi:hypothetical protein
MANITLVVVNTGINRISGYQLDTHETIVWRGDNYPDLIIEAVEYKNSNS